MPYYFSWFIALLFTDQSVYFSVSNCSWNYKPSGVCERGFSLSVISYEKIIPHIAASNYLYLFVWANFCNFFSFFFSNRPSVMDQKLNWNVMQAVEKPFTIGILSYMDSWCLVPFSSNVTWDCPQSLSLFCLREWEQCNITVTKWRNSSPRGFRSRIHSKNIPMRISRHKYISCNSNPRQSERGMCGQRSLFLEKEMSQLLSIKTNWWGS